VSIIQTFSVHKGTNYIVSSVIAVQTLIMCNLILILCYTVSDVSKTFVELPPELCSIIMSPISVNTLYSFSFVPSIMHRLESLLGAFNFQKMHLDHCPQNRIETFKVGYY
jgi:hypothetical protein